MWFINLYFVYSVKILTYFMFKQELLWDIEDICLQEMICYNSIRIEL